MTSIGLQLYALNYNAAAGLPTPAPQPTSSPAGTAQSADTSSSSAAVTVTLSDAAKAAMQAQTEAASSSDPTAAARATVNQLLSAAGATDAIEDGQATIDMSGLDRDTLFAVASDAGGAFTDDEQTVAANTMDANFQAAIAGPVAASRVTGDYAAVYKAGMDYLDQAGADEKASAAWTQERTALSQGYQQATTTPGVLPANIPNDPIAPYVQAVDAADPSTASAPRAIADVASDVRTALNEQYASATAPSAATGPNSGTIDLSAFDDRSLAAIALNTGAQFSSHEVLAAQTEIRSRTTSSVMAGFNPSGSSAALSGDLLSNYNAMSPEERQAEGWTPDLYAKLLQNAKDAQTIADMPGGSSSSSGDSVLDLLGSATSATTTGLLNQLA
ncbi:MAG TPA: hypothetical protein VHW05_06455 [Phenylobacterium sp.]|nr:hypothetical protein [Phenylobacterium sp.]